MRLAARWDAGAASAVPVAGGVLPVEVLGRGVPLLMWHGWTLDRRMWAPQAELAAHIRLVAVDRRGFGQASAPADLAAEPDDVLAVADALGLERFWLLGMSQGGKVALNVAARAARAGDKAALGRLAGLVLLGSALDGVDGPDEAVPLAAMAAARVRGDLEGMRALWRGHALMRMWGGDAAAVEAMLADYDGRDLGAGAALEATAGMILGLGVPVLVVVGARDTARRRANSEALAAAGAELLVLEGAGHLANMDDPGAFNAAVLEAVKSSG